MPRFVHFLYLVPLGLGAIISLRTFRQLWPRPFRQFSIFLLGTFLMELFAISWKLWLHDTKGWHYSKANTWIYNVYYIPEYLFYFLFYYYAPIPKIIGRGLFLTVCAIFFCGSVFNLFFIQGFFQLDTYTIVAGNIGVLIMTLTYFIWELKHGYPKGITRSPLFWISIGALIFHMASLPYFVFINYLSRSNLPLAIALFNILLVLNIFMHSMYLVTFLCKQPSQKKHI